MLDSTQIKILLNNGQLKQCSQKSELPYRENGPCLLEINKSFVYLADEVKDNQVTSTIEQIIHERTDWEVLNFVQTVLEHEFSLIIPTKQEKELVLRKWFGTFVSEYNLSAYTASYPEHTAIWSNSETLHFILVTEMRTRLSLKHFIDECDEIVSVITEPSVIMEGLSDDEQNLYRNLSLDFHLLVILKKVKWLRDEIIALTEGDQVKNKRPEITFGSSLNEVQLRKLYEIVRDLNLFNSTFSLADLKNIFACTVTEPYLVNSIQNFAMLFDLLQPNFIIATWKNVIEKNKILKGKKGALTDAHNLSASLAQVNKSRAEYKKIKDLIAGL